MKVRESGMPTETMWAGFFSPVEILQKLGLESTSKVVLDAGSGYGSFSIPAAKMIRGRVLALDIESAMIDGLLEKLRPQHIDNIDLIQTDFTVTGFCLVDETIDYVMLFNILHADNPVFLTKEAYRVLSPGGKLGVIHWNYDEKTPRGPPMAIRPKPEQCRVWMAQAGFLVSEKIDLPPFHYGFVGTKSPGKIILEGRKKE